MDDALIAFLVFVLIGVFFVILGIYTYSSKKLQKFLVKIKPTNVDDISGYNKALGKLYAVFGIIVALTALPILIDSDSLLAVFSIVIVIFEYMILLLVYVLKIESKYSKK